MAAAGSSVSVVSFNAGSLESTKEQSNSVLEDEIEEKVGEMEDIPPPPALISFPSEQLAHLIVTSLSRQPQYVNEGSADADSIFLLKPQMVEVDSPQQNWGEDDDICDYYTPQPF
jgi:hypothetical protein